MRMKLNLIMVFAMLLSSIDAQASWKSKRKNVISHSPQQFRGKGKHALASSLKANMDVQDDQVSTDSARNVVLAEQAEGAAPDYPVQDSLGDDTVGPDASYNQPEITPYNVHESLSASVGNSAMVTGDTVSHVQSSDNNTAAHRGALPNAVARDEVQVPHGSELGASQKSIVQEAHLEGEPVDNPLREARLEDDLDEQEYEQELEDFEHMNPDRDDVSEVLALEHENDDQRDADHQVNLDKFEFDIKAKTEDVLELVERGAELLRKSSEDKAFSAFSHDKKFIKGEIYLFVFDPQGTCLAHGQQADLLWQNLYNLKDTFGTFIVQAFIEQAKLGGGWVTYNWRNAIKKSYVKQVHKGNKTYIIGAGFYPHSKQDAVVSLVKGAVTNFNSLLQQGHPKEEAFSDYSYLLGKFVYGDLYLYALDFNGLHYAHGGNPGLIGSNAINYRDINGKLVNQEIIAKLKDTDLGKGIWIEYISKNAPKKAYAEKVVDKDGKYYFIACGYYPDATRDHAVDLVRRGYRYMKANGKTQASRSFSDKNDDSFRYGDLYLVVYDLKGICVANGDNPSLIGQSQLEVRDTDNTYYVKEMIKEATTGGGGWIDYKDKNSFRSVYVEKINLGTDSYVIGCGIFPLNKHETMSLMVKGGVDYLSAHDDTEAFREFVKGSGSFIKGDLHLFVFDANGICLAYGDDYNLIWRNLMNSVDDNGKPQVKMMINAIQRGPNTITYRLNGSTKAVYVAPVEKNGKLYVVGSGFYL